MHRQTPDIWGRSEVRSAERHLHRHDGFQLVRGRQIGREWRSVHQPFVPSELDVAVRPQPALLDQPPEDPRRRRAHGELPCDQNQASALSLRSAAVLRHSAGCFELTMPSRTASPATRRAITPGAFRFRLKVHRSRIHRWGVFATEAIPARQKVIEYVGELVRCSRVLKVHKRRWKSSLHTAVYLLSLNKRWVANGAVGGNGAELINHCCDPNLAQRRAGGRVSFMSRRRIRAGEELTLDYRFHPDAEPIPCQCGSPNCRGTINYQRRRKHR
jgi:hypothetical protein